MSTANKHIRNGFSAVRSYLYGPLELADFVKQVFGAEEVERVADGNGAHVELQIGDSLIALDLGNQPDPASEWFARSFVYVYVEDVDAVYQRAMQAGAQSLEEPKNKPYQERNAGFKDMSGNVWGISTYIG